MLRFAHRYLTGIFPYLPQQSGCNMRLRATPVPCGMSCGEMSDPPALRMPLTCSRADCSPSATDSWDNEKVRVGGRESRES